MTTELRKAAEEMRAFIGVMCGRGPDSVIPETVSGPLGVPIKVGAICAAADAALAAPRDELAAVPPSGHVRLPDGRDLKISDTGMEILRNMADGKPWNFALPPYQHDANPIARAAIAPPTNSGNAAKE